MSPNPLQISSAEWDVMDVLWRESPQTAREIVEKLARRNGWQPSTTRTLLRRLVGKNAVLVSALRRPAVYQPALSREKCVRQESRSLLRRFFRGRPVEMLVHLVEETPLSSTDIERLRKILSRKEDKP
jgi:BlaI family penicillinase repressor